MINLHPTAQQLMTYVDGSMEPMMALVVACHVDMCAHCRAKVEQLQLTISDNAFALESQDNVSFGDMMASIMALPAAEPRVRPASPPTLELDGRSFVLPRPLRRFVDKTGNWSHLLGNLWQAPVDIGGGGKAQFIFMEKGGRVPEHTHRGNETTLVIDGEFSDGLGHYDSGDFIHMDGHHVHTPRSDADEGCLVFSVVDKPLHFTSGIARLLNPFSQLFF
ncbi:ChrR family anti-sigma-E factor [Aestuariibacter halophilus]|uniref:ChrR family anti-sigma-E factor n=1 Tax=Fluctibacter halophilus TaxID=226011 RepID=A0ABS8G2M7_9ALTE|nr:ChrR family anti-sigma-E factor [Aestuariibacter halophilus]MCC2614749.1 ChrR family anti-sigma-E factor [Aestuariibacter halophilus]